MAVWVDWQGLRASSVAGRIGIAVLAVAVASAARYGLELINPAILGLGPIYLAVLVAALIGGWLSGGLATLFGGLVFSFAFIAPQYQLTIATPEHAVDMATFFAISFLIVLLIEANQRQKALTQGFEPAVSRLRLWVAGLGLVCGGLALSAGVALTTYENAKALARSEFDRLAEAHAQQLQARLGEREAAARMVAAIFVAPGALIPNALAPIKEGFFPWPQISPRSSGRRESSRARSMRPSRCWRSKALPGRPSLDLIFSPSTSGSSTDQSTPFSTSSRARTTPCCLAWILAHRPLAWRPWRRRTFTIA